MHDYVWMHAMTTAEKLYLHKMTVPGAEDSAVYMRKVDGTNCLVSVAM